MPRINKKTSKIVFDILGTPGNLQKPNNKKKSKVSPKDKPNVLYTENIRQYTK